MDKDLRTALWCDDTVLVPSRGGYPNTGPLGGNGSAVSPARPAGSNCAVTATLPAAEATEVALSSHIVVALTQPIDHIRGEGAIQLCAGDSRVAGDIFLSADGMRLIFAPARYLARSTTYTANIRAEIGDAQGQIHRLDHSWQFTTEDVGWTTPERVDEVADGLGAYFSLDDSAPSAIDADGNIFVVWVHDDGNETCSVRARRYDAKAARWGGTANLGTMGNAGIDTPALGVDARGRALVVWVENHEHDGRTVARAIAVAYTKEGGWEAATEIARVNTVYGNGFMSPQLAMNADGKAFAVWQHDNCDPRQRANDLIWAAQFLTDGRWGASVQLDARRYHGRRFTAALRVVIDAAGNAMAAWYESVGPLRDGLFACFFDAGTGAWSPASRIEPDEISPSNYLQLAVNPAGGWYAIVWIVDGRTRQALFDSTTGSWQITDSPVNAARPQVLLDDRRGMHWAWVKQTTNRPQVWAAYRTATGKFKARPVMSRQQECDDVEALVLQSNGSGNLLLVWRCADRVVSARYRSNDKCWTEPQVVAPEFAATLFPTVAHNRSGKSVLAWLAASAGACGIGCDVMHVYAQRLE